MGFSVRSPFRALPGARVTVGPDAPSPAAPASASPLTVAPAVRPGGRMAKWEKELHEALLTAEPDRLVALAATRPEVVPLVAPLEGLAAYADGDAARALPWLQRAWEQGDRVEEHPFVRTHLAAGRVCVSLAAGVVADLPISRDAVGLALAALEQAQGETLDAVAVVEALDPSVVAALALVALYLESGRQRDVVDLTNVVVNVDDATALLVIFRGIALRQLGIHQTAHLAFAEALKARDRGEVVQLRARVERARCHLEEGDLTSAVRDLERVVAQEPAFPGVRELLDLSLVITQIRPTRLATGRLAQGWAQGWVRSMVKRGDSSSAGDS